MIQRCFSFVSGISSKKINELEFSGVSWDNFSSLLNPSFTDEEKNQILKHINIAKENLSLKNQKFFAEKLERKNHFLLFEHFLDSVCYLDIETTGLSRHHNEITTISAYDGKEVKTFILGINMDSEELCSYLNKYKMFVTYNGLYFDMPFIEHKFPFVSFSDKLHVDLRWVCRKVGLCGGLKKIEKEVGLSRDDDLEGVDGLMAVRLWKKYQKYGNQNALDLLVKYNQADVVNLEKLAKIVFERLNQN
jgi:uncharacterized protein